jgi:fructose-bisphosphate aldolase class II
MPGKYKRDVKKSDGRLAMTAVIRKIFAEKPGEFDPRKYLR